MPDNPWSVNSDSQPRRVPLGDTNSMQPRLIIEIADQDRICDAARWFTERGLAR